MGILRYFAADFIPLSSEKLTLGTNQISADIYAGRVFREA